MKSFILSTFILVASTCLSDVNLINNGGFESPPHSENNGTNPDHWKVCESAVGDAPEKQVRTRDLIKRSGNLGLELGAGQSMHDGELWQTIPVTKGNKYELSVWARVYLVKKRSINQNFQIDLRDGEGTNGTILASIHSQQKLTDRWLELSTEITATSSALTIHIRDTSASFGTKAEDNNDIILDDIWLKEHPELETKGLLCW